MSDESSGLTLVHEAELAQRQEAFARMAIREFGAGSFSRVLDRADFLKKGVLIKEKTASAEQIEDVKRMMLEILREHAATLTAEHINVPHVLERARAVAMNLRLREFMEGTTHPELPAENVRRHLDDLGASIIYSARRACLREELGSRLLEHGVTLCDSDLPRLLIYEMNLGRTVPQILVLPNTYKRYNPFLYPVDPELQIDAKALGFLRLVYGY